VRTLAPAGAWWAAEFPTAAYAVQLTDAQDLLGVFAADPDALRLLGVVSPADGLTRTLLHHDPPVVVLAFPLGASAAWTTDAAVTGQALGVWGVYQEVYDSRVDADGVLATPYGEFPVLRVRTTLTRSAGLLTTTVRSFLFAAECYGAVGNVVSRDGEPLAEFGAGSGVLARGVLARLEGRDRWPARGRYLMVDPYAAAAAEAPASPEPTTMMVYFRLFAGLTSLISERCRSHFCSSGPPGVFARSSMISARSRPAPPPGW